MTRQSDTGGLSMMASRRAKLLDDALGFLVRAGEGVGRPVGAMYLDMAARSLEAAGEQGLAGLAGALRLGDAGEMDRIFQRTLALVMVERRKE